MLQQVAAAATTTTSSSTTYTAAAVAAATDAAAAACVASLAIVSLPLISMFNSIMTAIGATATGDYEYAHD